MKIPRSSVVILVEFYEQIIFVSIRLQIYKLKLSHCFDHCDDILHRCVGLDIVYCIEYKSAIYRQDLTLPFYMLRHLFGSAKGKNLLRVGTSAPENQVVAVFLL